MGKVLKNKFIDRVQCNICGKWQSYDPKIPVVTNTLKMFKVCSVCFPAFKEGMDNMIKDVNSKLPETEQDKMIKDLIEKVKSNLKEKE